MRRLLAPIAVALSLAGCSHAPVAGTPVALEGQAPAMDLATKFSVPSRETGRRDRATVNAEYHLALEADENGPPSAAQIFRAHEQRRAVALDAASTSLEKAAGLQPSRLQSLGPSNVGGRVRAIAFDPGAPSRILAGTASGGLWISNDGAASWHANFDYLPNLSVTTIAFVPFITSILYLGTGEASAGLVGVGAFKSVDGGNTWQYLTATNTDANTDWRFVNRIAVHPAQTQVILAALTNNSRATGAIYRSSDAGATWTRVSTAKALDVDFEPGNQANAIAGLDGGNTL